ncbi:hypothetical protein LTR85_001765 [Meristemomyces frigidus]|nr:hypothetical protein LTR85_001765 [Meristemomyces frigidus]
MADDARVHATTRKIARVPHSDYVMEGGFPELPSLSSTQLDGSGSEDGRLTQLRELCMMLQRWQESQTVLLRIDDRFRFRCLLSWLQASSSDSPRRITRAAAAFLEQHAQDQYEILMVEDQNIQDIMEVRQEEGLPLRKDQLGRVVDMDEDMQQAAEAIKKVGELVAIAVAARLVEGQVDKVHVETMDGTREEYRQEVEVEPPDEDMDWRVDQSFDGL